MKKLLALAAACMLNSYVFAQDEILLPQPSTNISMTLVEALRQRHSERSFADKAVSNDVLAQILWAACGINRPDQGKITAPSAINAQDIKVYVCSQDGAFLYQPKDNKLIKVSEEDLRPLIAGPQAFAASAPLSLLLVSDHQQFGDHRRGAERMGVVDAGYVSENIALICTALGLNTVPRMTMDGEALKKALQLDESADLVINHPIGYPVGK